SSRRRVAHRRRGARRSHGPVQGERHSGSVAAVQIEIRGLSRGKAEALRVLSRAGKKPIAPARKPAEEIYRSDREDLKNGESAETGSPAHRLDESPAGYSSAGCSPVSGPCDRTKRGRNQARQWSAEVDGSRPAMQWCSFEPVRPVWPRVAWSEQW